MADYAGALFLSQAHSTDDESSKHSPRSFPALSSPAAAASASSSKRTTSSKNNKLSSAVDHHHHRHQITIESTTPKNSSGKPRGRPPGSKNKPKPPIVITKDSDSAMKLVVLEISAGADIIDDIVNFARRNHTGITIMSVSGSVSHVTLRQPISHGQSLSLHGPFHLLSLAGSFFVSSSSSSSSKSSGPSSSSCSSFGVTLAGAQGQVFGGIVAGKVMAASLVVVVAATFSDPSIHNLPISEEGDQRRDHQADHHQQESKPNITVSTTGANDPSCSGGGKSIPVYAIAVANPTPNNCQIPPDVMHWASPPSPPY